VLMEGVVFQQTRWGSLPLVGRVGVGVKPRTYGTRTARESRWHGSPSPLVGEGGAQRRMRGIAGNTHRVCGSTATPHPDIPLNAEYLSLSHKGRGEAWHSRGLRLRRN